MNKVFVESKEIRSENYTSSKLPKGDYENCRFIECIFAGSDLSAINFVECIFEHCDFSNAKIYGTSFRDVHFQNCKLLGLNFDDCNKLLISFRFTDCILNFSSFHKLDIPKSHFAGCKLQEVDFTNTNLKNAVFDECDLSGARFERSDLRKADFRTAVNYSIDPEDNQITGAKFSIMGLAGLLDKYDIEISH